MQNAICKITVIERTVNQKLIDRFMNKDMKSYSRCSKFREGDEFLVTCEFDMPESFCHWAWADIRKDILGIIHGASFSWFNKENMTIAGCTDWFKPVIFKIEKI